MICGVMHILESQEWRLVSLRLDSLKWSFGEGPHMDFTSFMMGGILLLSRPIIFFTIGPFLVIPQNFSVNVPVGIVLL